MEAQQIGGSQPPCGPAEGPYGVRRPPGFLLEPFGWVNEVLWPAIQNDAMLCCHLLAASRARMHVIAVALAHADDAVSPRCAHLYLAGKFRDVIDHSLGVRPPGLKRIVRHLPERVLKKQHYKTMVTNLDDPEAAGILRHASVIDHALIDLIVGTPVGLRKALVTAVPASLHYRLANFTKSLELLVSRGAASTLDALVNDMKAIFQPRQFSSHIRSLIENLPLPDSALPCTVGIARRLDRPSEIRDLARDWKNCLSGYVDCIDDGVAALYQWHDAKEPACVLINRMGRFGWVVEDVRGPNNTTPSSSVLTAIEICFAAIGIPSRSIVQPLTTIALGADGD